MQLHPKEPQLLLMYLSCPIFFHRVLQCVQIPFEKQKNNGYCNECWLSRSDEQERGENCRTWEKGLFRCSGVIEFHKEERFWGEAWLFFPPCAFSCTQGSRTLQEDRALPRHASLEGFLQATSRLFGCHWDCLKRICFFFVATYSREPPDQEEKK